MNAELVVGDGLVYYYNRAGIPVKLKKGETIISLGIETLDGTAFDAHKAFMFKTFRSRIDLAEECVKRLNAGENPENVQFWFEEVGIK